MRKLYVRERHGVHAEARFFAAASPELAAALKSGDDAPDWVDFSLFVEATELVDKLFGQGDMRLAWEIGRFGAERNLGVWKQLVMKMVKPSTVMNIAAGLWSQHYDAGRLVVIPTDDGSVRVQIADFPVPARVHCLSIGGWAERTLQLGRPNEVSVREESCRANGDDACELTLRWS